MENGAPKTPIGRELKSLDVDLVSKWSWAASEI